MQFQYISKTQKEIPEEQYQEILKMIENERKSKKYGIFYIYVLLNDNGNIKIGVTHNFNQRKKSLSGSNTGGNKIINYYVSKPTYMYIYESVLHNKFAKFRIPGTEWFQGITFEEVILEVEKIFNEPGYQRREDVRKEMNIDYYYKKILRKQSIEKREKELTLDEYFMN